MSTAAKTSKRKHDAEEPSAEDSETKVATTEEEVKVAPSSASKKQKAESKPEVVFPLSNKRKVTVGMFANKVLVNIREYYEDKKTGEEKPGNKGIALNLEQWQQLKAQADEIDAAVRSASDKDKVFPLSDKRKVTVSLFKSNVLVNIREFYEDKLTGVEKPGSKGIALTMPQWEPFKAQFEKIDEAVKERSS